MKEIKHSGEGPDADDDADPHWGREGPHDVVEGRDGPGRPGLQQEAGHKDGDGAVHAGKLRSLASHGGAEIGNLLRLNERQINVF